MPKRICWKKGMRLTDEVLRASDDAELELIGKAFVLGSAGQFGLLPNHRPFNLSLNIGKEAIEVESLECLATTKEGRLIDVNYRADFDKTFETRVPFPDHLDASVLYLTIDLMDNQWQETSEGFEEPVCRFSLITPNNPIAENALPIARLINNDYGGWRVDDTDFVPPCLFVSSHQKYEELLGRFQEVLSDLHEKVRILINSDARDAMRMFWPMLQQIMISVDKERNLMTPMMLLGIVQRLVCAFTTSCELDDNIGLAEAGNYYNFAFSPYNRQNVYQKIKEGVGLCFEIRDKVDRIQPRTQEKKHGLLAPSIADSQLYQNCRSRNVSIPIINHDNTATVFYSTDGSNPTRKMSGNSMIVFDSDFNKLKTPEPDKTIVIKLKAMAEGVSSEIATYTVTLHKDYQVWDGYEI